MNIGQEQQILVEVGALEFCIDLNEVISIINPPKMVRLPAARGAFTRAFKYLDELGAAVSVRAKFELDERQDLQSGQLLLGRINERLAGFWFDKVVGIHKLGDDMQVYEDIQQLHLPVHEIDQLFVYKQRLIPHISLSGLLRFEQASAWKQWLETEKPEIERKLREAEQAEQARLEEQKQQKAEEELVRQAPMETPSSLSVEALYALMDEAGVVPTQTTMTEPEEAVADTAPDLQEAIESQIEAPEEAVTAESHMDEAELAIPSPSPEDDVSETIDAKTDSGYSLAVPVASVANHSVSSDKQASIQEERETETAAGEGEDDALFALEKKSEAYRQRMDAEQQVDLTEYQIIKVGDRGLIRLLRRWLRRLVWAGLLLVLVMLSVVTNDYVRQYGDPLERVYVESADGKPDWAASYAQGRRELGQYASYVVDVVRERLQEQK